MTWVTAVKSPALIKVQSYKIAPFVSAFAQNPGSLSNAQLCFPKVFLEAEGDL